MGSSQTKKKISSSQSEKMVEGLKSRVRLLQGEINEIMRMRETENQVYERELMVFAFKQAEWKRERKRLRNEVRKLRKVLEEREDMLWIMESTRRGYSAKKEWELVALEEKERRDETVEKWKQLYFAIKIELDHLIQCTRQEKRLCWKADEEEEALEELKGKEERIELLQAKLSSMEYQEPKREREMDILRQSLRIMSHRKRAEKLGQRPIQKF